VNSTIFLFLLQDGVINGAIYALVAISLVLVFAVTRVILVPQGEFVAFSAFTMAAFEAGRVPATAWLLVGLGVLAVVATAIFERRTLTLRRVLILIVFDLGLPLLLLALSIILAPAKLGQVPAAVITIAMITVSGPLLYQIAFQPLQGASVLILLMAAFGVHFSLTGLGLVFYGPEGIATEPFTSMSFSLGGVPINAQSIIVVGVTTACLLLFAVFFENSLLGKALHACASNRLGARLVGIPTGLAGQIAFAFAAALGAIAGILIGSLLTVYYDSGFIIGLKAFIAAIVGGLISFPAAVLAALGVGFAESLFSFWASNFKEVLVFTLLLPVLLLRSLRSGVAEDEQ
jgi:branched-chain amino acid transport system permease protein